MIRIYYKIKLKLYVSKFKKKIELQNFIKWCIFTRIRVINNFKNCGYNDSEDNTTYELTNHILKIKLTQNNQLKEILDFSNKDEKVLQFSDLYFKIQNSINKNLEKDLIKNDIKPQKAIFEEIENKPIRLIKKKLKKIIKNDYEILIDRTAFKIEFSLQEILSYLTLTTTIIFCGGYLYNKILFGLYDINIGYFFNLSDYVSSSIEQIQAALIGGIVTLIVFLFNLIELKNDFSVIKNPQVKLKRRVKDYVVIITVVAYYTIGCIYLEKFFYKNLLLPSLIITVIVIQKISFKYFNNPLKSFPFLLFTSIFLVGLSTKAVSEYYSDEKENLKIVFKDKKLNDKIINCNLILVTSEYIFLESKNKNVKVYKKDLVESFEKEKKKKP